MVKDFKSSVIRLSEKFSDLMNIVILGIMLIIIVGVIGLLIQDTISFYRKGFSTGIGTLLGSLLVLWVLLELLHTQIDYLKGGKFNISVFILVAMVAFIRKLMVASLKPEELEVAYYPIIIIVALSLVYWLIRRAEKD
jgi:uncharacterized membrane protein (DUF373 family)